MFHTIREPILSRMRYLELVDAKDRSDGTPRLKRLRQIPPETGRFLAILAASSPRGACIEIGTSAGYSTLWLALACELVGKTVTTFEVSPEKARLAHETFRVSKLESRIVLVEGDAREHIPAYDGIAFCFLDAEKEIYADCYEALVPRLAPGGLLIADNVISHRETLAPFLSRALGDDRVDAVIVQIGQGVLLCRKA